MQALAFRLSMRAAAAGQNLARLALAGLLLSLSVSAGQFEGWSTGRATFYGDDGSIHWGSCMFGQIDGSKGTGWDVAALSDKVGDYDGSCGRCYEVACRPEPIQDGYGNTLDHAYACNGGSTVTVMITDTCPCYYPSNHYSNSRWCCGDQYHMDLSRWAFEKIANTGAGSVGIYYRVVSCPGGSYSASSSSSSNSQDSGWNANPWDSNSNGNSWDSGSQYQSSDGSSQSSDGSSYSDSYSGGGSSYQNAGGESDWMSQMMQKSNDHRNSEWPNRGLRKRV